MGVWRGDVRGDTTSVGIAGDVATEWWLARASAEGTAAGMPAEATWEPVEAD
jgi:hypothetical protein